MKLLSAFSRLYPVFFLLQQFFTYKPTDEGPGLGLSLTYDIVVKSHGGSMKVNSIEGEDSEFTVILPL